MTEYIEREAAIRALLNDSPEQVSYSREDAADCIRYMDAADVAPVRHGRWIETGKGLLGTSSYKCSDCEFPMPFYNGYNYCPNCGCRMDLEG